MTDIEKEPVQDELCWIKQMIGSISKFIEKFQNERIAIKQTDL